MKRFSHKLIVVLCLSSSILLLLTQPIENTYASPLHDDHTGINITQPKKLREEIIDFITPVSVQQAIDWAATNEVIILELRHYVTDATGIVHTSGVVLTADFAVATDPETYYNQTLRAMFTNLKAAELKRSRGSLQDELATPLSNVIEQLAISDRPVYGLLVSGSEESLTLLQQDANVSVVSELEINEALGPEGCSNTWAANTGYISVGPAASNRAAYQIVKWTSASRLNNLKACPNPTYEVELWLNNYDRRTYLSTTVKGWSSSLPRAYRDTNFSDGSNERSYTIGTADASQLVLNTSYYTWYETTTGNTSSDSGKVTGQRGERSPSFCYSSWCVWPKATAVYIRAWQLSVPSSRTWTY